jgi:hypothetical protein
MLGRRANSPQIHSKLPEETKNEKKSENKTSDHKKTNKRPTKKKTNQKSGLRAQYTRTDTRTLTDTHFLSLTHLSAAPAASDLHHVRELCVCERDSAFVEKKKCVC